VTAFFKLPSEEDLTIKLISFNNRAINIYKN